MSVNYLLIVSKLDICINYGAKSSELQLCRDEADGRAVHVFGSHAGTKKKIQNGGAEKSNLGRIN